MGTVAGGMQVSQPGHGDESQQGPAVCVPPYVIALNDTGLGHVTCLRPARFDLPTADCTQPGPAAPSSAAPVPAERAARQLAADPQCSLARGHPFHLLRLRGCSRGGGICGSGGGTCSIAAAAAGAAAAGGSPKRGRAAGRGAAGRGAAGRGRAAAAAARARAAGVLAKAGDWADAPDPSGDEEPWGPGAWGRGEGTQAGIA